MIQVKLVLSFLPWVVSASAVLLRDMPAADMLHQLNGQNVPRRIQLSQ